MVRAGRANIAMSELVVGLPYPGRWPVSEIHLENHLGVRFGLVVRGQEHRMGGRGVCDAAADEAVAKPAIRTPPRHQRW